MRQITVNYENKPCYDIIIERSFNALSESYDFSGHKILVITDDNVATNVLPDFKKEFKHDFDVFSIIPGEKSKTLDTVKSIYKYLIESKYTRTDIIIALGGGVIGDMAGYTAATYLRGVPYIQVPTSLLAMVDSSIGGKTGVDFDGYKNMVGAFNMPKLVYVNVSALNSLPDRQFFNGFAEVMKHGLIKNASFYQFLLDKMYEICEKDLDTLEDMIEQSLMIKKLVVEKDPLEKGDRMMLNFGHTIGHAIEKYKGFELLHGECVSLGCVAAAFISWKKNWLSKDEYYEIRDMFVPFYLPISTEMLDIDEVVKNIKSDKKMDGDTLRFILLKKVGKAVIDTTVTEDELREALEEINFDEKWETE